MELRRRRRMENNRIVSQKSCSSSNFQFICAINHLMLIILVLSDKTKCKNGVWALFQGKLKLPFIFKSNRVWFCI